MFMNKETKTRNNNGVKKMYSLRPPHNNGSKGGTNGGSKGAKGGKQK